MRLPFRAREDAHRSRAESTRSVRFDGLTRRLMARTSPTEQCDCQYLLWTRRWYAARPRSWQRNIFGARTTIPGRGHVRKYCLVQCVVPAPYAYTIYIDAVPEENARPKVIIAAVTNTERARRVERKEGKNPLAVMVGVGNVATHPRIDSIGPLERVVVTTAYTPPRPRLRAPNELRTPLYLFTYDEGSEFARVVRPGSSSKTSMVIEDAPVVRRCRASWG